MPTVELNKKVFEKLVGKELPIEELKDRISMLGTDLEDIEGNTIRVEVFPQRPDMLSEQGFARAFSSFIGVKTGLADFKVQKSGAKVIIDKSLKTVRPYTACAIVKNLKFDDEKIREVIQLQEKLHVTYGRNRKKAAIGIYPMEAIEMPITFTAKKPDEIKFQPLEFDKEITGLEILSKHSTGRDYGHLLEGLDKFPVFIDAKGDILSMPPIVNSHTTGKITEDTKDVFIECSGFDFNVLSICLNIIVTTLSDMGGDIFSMELEYPDEKKVTPNLEPVKWKLDIGYVNKLLGMEFDEKEIAGLLSKMGYDYDSLADEKKVLVPCYRADILHQIDLVEDVAIAYGYENFTEDLPNIATIGEESPLEIYKRRIANILIGVNLLECYTYHLTNDNNQNKKMMTNLNLIELANAQSSDYNVLRTWVMPSLLDVLQNNRQYEYPQNIFDIGIVFKHSKDTETKTLEQERLSVALCGKDADYTKILQIFDYLMHNLGLEYSIEETNHPSFIPGRVGRVTINDKQVAYIGETHPQVLENFELEMPVAAFELNLTEMTEDLL